MHERHSSFLVALCLAAIMAAGCYSMRRSAGGGQTSFDGPRRLQVADIALPDAYRIESVASGLTFPTGITFDDQGRAYVVESGYSYGEVWTTPRLVRLDEGGTQTVVATGGRNGPWNGVIFHKDSFFVAEGGVLEGGRILRIGVDGTITAIVENLPSFGDHHTNGPAVGPDGWIYFAQGVATNSAVVGEDSAKFGWLARKPDFHDIPCEDIELTGQNFTTDNPLTPDGNDKATTGAFSPFGRATTPGQKVPGRVPCSGAILRVRPAGGTVELVAWGLRNPFGLGFSPDGELFATDNSYDERGSRPIWGSGDLLFKIQRGTWYGWPDFHGPHAVTETIHDSPDKPRPKFVLAKHPNAPQKPVALLGVHASADGFDFSRSERFGHIGQAFIALFGDQAPVTGKVLRPVGFKVVRVDVKTGVIEDFVVNQGGTNGPASRIGTQGLERPVAARFTPDGSALYIVDFGVLKMSKDGSFPVKETGVIWRVTRGGTT